MSSAALKAEVMDYLDQMDTERIGEVLLFARKCAKRPQSPYGKYKTAEEYEEAQKLWAELQELVSPTPTILPDDYDYHKEAMKARCKKYENLT